MMKIKSEQTDRMGEENERAFTSRLASFLVEQYPAAGKLPRQELLGGVQVQIERARRYGLENEDQIATYTLTAWQLGSDFDREFPAAEHLLNSPDYTPEDKRQWLEAWTLRLFFELSEKE